MSHARIGLKHLRAFREVATFRHFTRAAESLGLSQPALSALIAQLEADLGAQLLIRTTRTVELTSAGREFLISADRILSDTQTAFQQIADLAQLKRGRLRIAALPSLCTTLLPQLTRRFRDLHPDVSVSIIDAQGDDVVDLIVRRQVDFGIGYVPSTDTVIAEAILRDRLEAVASRALFEKVPKRMKWRELEPFDIIAMHHGTTIRYLFEDALRRSGANLRVALQAHQMPTALAYATAGLGIAVLPTFGIPDALAREAARIELVDPIVERPLSILRNPHDPANPAAAAFLSLMRRQRRIKSSGMGAAIRSGSD